MSDIKSNERSLFSIHDPQGVKLLSRLRLNFSHLNEHKFRHKLKDINLKSVSALSVTAD